MDAFTRGMLAAALWSTNDEPSDRSLSGRFSIRDISPQTLQVLERDAKRFQEQNVHALKGFDPEQAGQDFWLTRTRSGAGFWDGDYPEPQATQLTRSAQGFGEIDLYVGDDSKVHASGGTVRFENPLASTGLKIAGGLTPTAKTALYVGAGVAASGALIYLLKPRPIVPPPVAPAGSTTLSPVALPLPTVPLIRGRHYYAAVQVSSLIHAFASNASVVSYAQKMGFTNVQAYLDASQIPSWWPAGAGNSGNIWAEADYTSASKQFNLPSQVVAAWILGPENA